MKGSLSAGRACSVGKRGGASVGSGAWPCRGVAKAALRAPGWCAPRGRRRLCPARQCGCGAALASCSSPLLGPTCPAGRRLASKNTATGAAAAAAATSPWNRRRRRCREGRPRSGPAGDRGAGSERPSRVPHRTQSQPSTLLHLLHPHLTLIPWPPVGVRPHPAFPAACRASLPAAPVVPSRVAQARPCPLPSTHSPPRLAHRARRAHCGKPLPCPSRGARPLFCRYPHPNRRPQRLQPLNPRAGPPLRGTGRGAEDREGGAGAAAGLCSAWLRPECGGWGGPGPGSQKASRASPGAGVSFGSGLSDG